MELETYMVSLSLLNLLDKYQKYNKSYKQNTLPKPKQAIANEGRIECYTLYNA